MHNLGDYLKDIQLPKPEQETYEDIEAEFKGLVKYLKAQELRNLQQGLKLLRANQVPKVFRRSFNFFKTLSGPSKNFMLDIAEGRKSNKAYPRQGNRGTRSNLSTRCNEVTGYEGDDPTVHRL